MPEIDREISEGYWDEAAGIVGTLHNSDGTPSYKSRLRTPAQLQSERGDLAWLVYDLIPGTGIGRLVGPPGEGKTFVALDLAMRVARKVPTWYGHDVDTHGQVLYILMEGAFDAPNRVSAWEISNNEYRTGEEPLFLPEEDFDLARDKSLRQLAVDYESYGLESPPALLIIDTQALALPGTDENDNTALGMAIKRLKAFASQTHACVLLVHHPAKSGTGGRGAGSVRAALDFEIELTKGSLRFTKNKYGPTPTFGFDLQIVDLGRSDQKGRPVRSCWAKPGKEKKAKGLAELARDATPEHSPPIREQLVTYLRDHNGTTKSSVCKALFKSKSHSCMAQLEAFKDDVFTVKTELAGNNRPAEYLYLLGQVAA